MIITISSSRSLNLVAADDYIHATVFPWQARVSLPNMVAIAMAFTTTEASAISLPGGQLVSVSPALLVFHDDHRETVFAHIPPDQAPAIGQRILDYVLRSSAARAAEM